MASKLEKYAEDLVERALEGEVSLNEAIEDLDTRLEVYDRVKVFRDRLVSARRALMGVGSRTTANAGNRVTQDEVAKAMSMQNAGEGDGGFSVAELVAMIPGSTDGQIRGHLNRGAGERFLKRPSDNRWFLRDPENGINTVDDLPEED